jgi:hypothetical protein
MKCSSRFDTKAEGILLIKNQLIEAAIRLGDNSLDLKGAWRL